MGVITVVVKTYKDGQMGYNSYKLVATDDQGRESAGLIGNLLGGGIGGFLGLTIGGVYGAVLDEPVAGAAAGFVAGDYYGGNYGEDLGKAIYDSFQKQYDTMSEAEKQALRDKGFLFPFDSHKNNPPFPINPDVNDNYKRGKNWIAPRIDPLVLDLDGDGIETLGVNATTHVVFDYDGDGVKTGTGWIAGDDGFVVLDRNGNGVIDNGGELFGDQTSVNGAKASDGFSALSAEDTDHDGTFDADDANYTNVRVWQDTNSDGISQTTELHTLTELGIASINLTSTATNTATNGNTQNATGNYTKTDGTTGEAGNLNFDQNSFYREFTDPLPLTDTALALPDMQGSGMVRDLREASTLSAGITTTLQSMSTYETHDQMMAKIDTLLSQWAETSSMATSVQLAASNHDVLVYVPTQSSEDFNLYYKMNVDSASNGEEGVHLVIYTEEEQSRYQYLLAEQARITRIISILERFNAETFVRIEDDKATGGTGTISMTVKDSGDSSGSGAFLSFDPRVFVGLSAAQVSFLDQSYAALKQSVYDGLVLQTRLSGYMDAINLTITEYGIGIDISGVIALLDERKNTNIINIIIDCAELNKYMSSNLAAIDPTATVMLDTWFKSLENEEISVTASEQQLINTVIGSSYQIGMDTNDILTTGARDDIVLGLSGNDTINAGGGDDTVYGQTGDDVLYGNSGTDVLDGGEGNDTIIADDDGYYYDDAAYADTLIGGKGDDTLKGSAGNDIYVFNIGDGVDTVYDYDYFGYYNSNNYYNAGNDTIQFGEGISANDLSFYASGNNLIIQYSASDKITIKDWYNANNSIENIKLSDGTMVTIPKITVLTSDNADVFIQATGQQYIVDAQGGNDQITTGSGNDTISGGEGDDIINAGDSTNTVSGGIGNDTITSGSGVDILDGGEGNDTINAGGGDDTVYGQTGDDVLYGNSGTDVLDGGEGNDTIIADDDGYYYDDAAYADTLIGGKGDDTLKGSAGNDIYVFNIGDGVDTVYDYDYFGYYNSNNYYNAGNDTIQFGEGISANDLSFYASGNNLIIQYSASDKITIKDWYNANNSIENIKLSDGTNYVLNTWTIGTVGNDTISGSSKMYGGLGDDTYIIDSIEDSVVEHLNEGMDTVQSSVTFTLGVNIENLTLMGTGVINGYGNTLNNTLIGNSTNNTLDGKSGTDTMSGGAGNDTYIVENTGDNVIENLNEGSDRVNASISYVLGANIENLQLTGTANNNGMGNELNNTIYANNGNNILDGANGTDTLSYAYATAGVNANIGITASQNTIGSGLDTILNFENLIGSNYDDTLIGNSFANSIIGGIGADIMFGGGGNDAYYIDNIGDQAFETVSYTDTTNAGGSDTVVSTVSYTLGSYIENLRLNGNGAINGTGNTLNNVIYTNSGNNILDGGSGADTVSYAYSTAGVNVDLSITASQNTIGSGLDTIINFENLYGSQYNDTLYGNSLSNTLYGDKGNDSLNGGAGNDTYIFNSGNRLDTINDTNGTLNAGIDTVKFGTGITKSSVSLFQSGANLLLSYGSGDVVTIANQSTTNNAIEKFALSDGNYLTSNDINVIIQSMNAYASSHDIAIDSIDTVKANQDLMNIVAGAWHK
ncbi:calcium-binding protein [Sulfuricurvum sp.]|uniref:calcium-binding protein n=1 Tax=Sulfuricurvum sp. TaxID=2025608 RepID=UPI002610F9AC|nr:calcium-binding protein [Sulfuricurvum sp.]MDD2780867.1 calcium-binding protein [Sulfuricurvum sp.]